MILQPGKLPHDVMVSDVVIIGCGVAGLLAALRARDRRITLISKTGFADGGSSVLAQGGVAVALGPGDTPERHATDTIDVGCGVCHPDVVRRVTTEGPRRLAELIALGARFDRDDAGRLELGREAAHSRRRVVHAAGDATGSELVRALAAEVRSFDRVRIVQNTLAVDLVRSEGRVVGVVTVDQNGWTVVHAAAAVVLATGGIGGVYRNSTNPVEATGDGLAMAARAGARLAGLEFVQFHPTAMDVGKRPMPLLTEALRGEGALLLDENGRRFMEPVHTMAELAPRDVVARAIWRHQSQGHATLLDATAIGSRLGARFPTVLDLCLRQGLDPRVEAIPVAPAAHYHMGGVVVDRDGRTRVDGLWACGEVAHTGLHGANRLASNSLLEGLVYGGRIGDVLARVPLPTADVDRVVRAWRHSGEVIAAQPWLTGGGGHPIERRVGETMWTWVGLERSESGLRRAQEELRDAAAAAPPGLGELGNLISVAGLVASSARARTESRGAHFRTDIPWQSEAWCQDLYVENGRAMEPRPMTAVG